MTCERFDQAIEEYVDGECRDVDAGAVREHLLACSSCRAYAERLSKLQEIVRQEFSRESAPAHLWPRIADWLDRPQMPIRSVGPRTWVTWGWRLVATTVVLVAVATGGMLLRTSEPTKSAIMRETTQDFMTFQMSRRAYDLVSANPVEVRAWFAGKIRFELPLLKNRAAGYELSGSRLCWLLDQRLGAFTYQRGDQLMTLYVLDGNTIAGLRGGEPSLGQAVVQRRADGYGNVIWRQGELLFSLVSRESRDEMLAFAAAVIGTEETSLPAGTTWEESLRWTSDGARVPIQYARFDNE
jgi:anti-sigma factor RsiW